MNKDLVRSGQATVRRRVRGGGAATIEDVAQRAAVSIKTVSRVINREVNVREETRERVQRAIDELNYRPNVSARNLAGNRADIVGLVYDNPSENYLMRVQHGALQACEELGYSLLLMPCDYRDPKLPERILQLSEERRVAGLLLTAPVCDVSILVQALDERRIHHVRMVPNDREHSGPYVTMDDYSAARDMARHLIELGHREIGVIAGHADHGASRPRLQGFADAIKAAGLKLPARRIVEGTFTFDSGVVAARQLLRGSARPTAIFAANDDMAAGALHAAHELGLSIPQQLSIAGYDDTPLSRYVWPSLTTVRQPIQDMAHTAVRSLVAHVAPKRGLPELDHEMLDYLLVVRESTGIAPGRA